MPIDQIFKDLKVIELASVLAGPAVGMFFAELGAQVTKIENKTTGGDVTRNWRLPGESTEASISAYYCSVNWHKKTILLDLKDPDDLARLQDLIREADVLISNYKLPSAEKLKVDYETCKALNPRLIYAQLTSFGESEDRVAFDVVLQAEAGFLYMCGEPDGAPVKMPVALIDLLAAHQLKEGILLALLQRVTSGKGSLVTSSLIEAAIASLANQATNYLMAGHIAQKMGTMHPNIAPYGDVFYTADQKALVLAVGTEKQFKMLCEVLELPDLAVDKRFETNHLRVKNRQELKSLLAPAIAKQDRLFWTQTFQQKGVPAGSIRNMAEVFELPQARAMILEELMDGIQTRRVKTVAFQVED